METRCIACLACISACPLKALSEQGRKISVDRTVCNGCGACVAVCPSGAWELLGVEYSVEDLALELMKDRVFFSTSRGGVTLSGGDPVYQFEASLLLLKKLKEAGIHTALDTCGMVEIDKLHKLLEYTDLLLYDLKLGDDMLHQRYTGCSNQLILKNLALVADELRRQSRKINLWIRTPLIPGVTATENNLQTLGSFISHNVEDVLERWELCAFNNLCRDKYLHLGREWEFAQTPLLTKKDLQYWESVAGNSGVNPKKIFATGPTRIETSPI